MPWRSLLDDERLARAGDLAVERGLALLEGVLVLRERVPVERDLVVARVVTPFPCTYGSGE